MRIPVLELKDVPTYSLRFPFRPQSKVTGLEATPSFSMGALSIRLREVPRYIVLEVTGFTAQNQAEAFVLTVAVALRWALIDQSLNCTFEVRLGDITWAKDPQLAGRNLRSSSGLPETGEPVHGLGDEGWPSIYQQTQKVLFLDGPPPTITQTRSASTLIAPLREAMGWTGLPRLAADGRFRLATDLLSAYHFESSANARLLTLAMILEVLAEPMDRHPEALALLEAWDRQLAERKRAVLGDDEAISALDSLSNDLRHRREISIRRRVRATSLSLAGYLDDVDAAQVARDAVATYDARSILVHNGTLRQPLISEAVDLGHRTAQLLLKGYVLRSNTL